MAHYKQHNSSSKHGLDQARGCHFPARPHSGRKSLVYLLDNHHPSAASLCQSARDLKDFQCSTEDRVIVAKDQTCLNPSMTQVRIFCKDYISRKCIESQSCWDQCGSLVRRVKSTCASLQGIFAAAKAAAPAIIFMDEVDSIAVTREGGSARSGAGHGGTTASGDTPPFPLTPTWACCVVSPNCVCIQRSTYQ